MIWTRRSSVLLLLTTAAFSQPQQVVERVPGGMRGRWVVTKQLTEKSLGCFDPENLERLVGLKLSLGDRALVWNGRTSKGLDPHARRVSSYEFQARFGQKPKDLGIQDDLVLIVQVTPSYGVPVNILLLRDPETMLIDACNIWLEAARDGEAGTVPGP